jgi:hypothetical protein
MSAAAAKGRVYVCGGSTVSQDKWEQQSIKQSLIEGVKSFRLKEATPPVA